MRAVAVAALLSLLLIPAGASAGGTIKASTHKGKTTIRVHTKGKPLKVKLKS